MATFDTPSELVNVDPLLLVSDDAAITADIIIKMRKGVHTDRPSATPAFDHSLRCSAHQRNVPRALVLKILSKSAVGVEPTMDFMRIRAAFATMTSKPSNSYTVA